MSYIILILSGIIFAEFVGYWLHILLHSEKVPALSRAHMLHHLRDYSPGKTLHRDEYLSSTDDRAHFLGIGFEWILPILTIVILSTAIMNLLGMSWNSQIIFTVSALAWGYFMFGYIHSSMHLKNFWMHKIPGLSSWHKNIRKLHDYHHLQISPDGRMQKNYGICFYWFDRLFRTYSPSTKPFDRAGHTAALERYKDLLSSEVK